MLVTADDVVERPGGCCCQFDALNAGTPVRTLDIRLHPSIGHERGHGLTEFFQVATRAHDAAIWPHDCGCGAATAEPVGELATGLGDVDNGAALAEQPALRVAW
jgi:hypothetical protein